MILIVYLDVGMDTSLVTQIDIVAVVHLKRTIYQSRIVRSDVHADAVGT